MNRSWTILEDILPLPWWGISALTGLVLLTFLINVVLYRRLNSRMKHFEASSLTLQTFMSGHELESILHDCIQKLDQLEQDYKKIDPRLSQVELKSRLGVDRAELLRFRAFENVGSDLSFAFALLNQEGDGVVLSSIHNREENRLYAKPIKEGLSTYSLTGEEKEVIERAMLGKKL